MNPTIKIDFHFDIKNENPFAIFKISSLSVSSRDGISFSTFDIRKNYLNNNTTAVNTAEIADTNTAAFAGSNPLSLAGSTGTNIDDPGVTRG